MLSFQDKADSRKNTLDDSHELQKFNNDAKDLVNLNNITLFYKQLCLYMMGNKKW